MPARTLTFFLAASLLGFAASPSPAAAANPRAECVRKVFPSAVKIELRIGEELVRTASGVAFAREGDKAFVLTNDHVVEPAAGWKAPAQITVLSADGRVKAGAKVTARGHVPDVDLAVLEVGAPLPVTPLAADDEVEIGDDLVVVGAPFGKSLSVSAGIVSSLEYAFPENASAPRVPTMLKTDAAIGYGSSGGGVFDVQGAKLVGVVEGYRTARVAFGKSNQYAFDVPMPGETFVAPAAKIRAFLEQHGLGDLGGERVAKKDLPRATPL